MPTAKPKSKQKNPNKVDLLKAIDRAPTKQNAMGPAGQGAPGAPGMTPGPGAAPMAPPPFPYPAHQLDRTAAGVPNITDMFLHSFQKTNIGNEGGYTPPPVGGFQKTNIGNDGGYGAPPMAAQGSGPRPQRRMG